MTTWKWKEVTDLIPVEDHEGTIGLLTEEEWSTAIERAINLMTKMIMHKRATNLRKRKTP